MTFAITFISQSNASSTKFDTSSLKHAFQCFEVLSPKIKAATFGPHSE